MVAGLWRYDSVRTETSRFAGKEAKKSKKLPSIEKTIVKLEKKFIMAKKLHKRLA